ncbi:MAG: FixH family protein [Gammaproteobacteria bacterium]|nr:FixH family protein [Gammaproteobacteria bacterium]MDH3412608.1 FixH family protein [Gammaproteobacteria bacterium]
MATPARAWYRHPLVWMIIAIPGSAVLVGIAMLVLAAASYDGLVVDDYYKRGLEINRDLERDRAAASLGLSAGVVFDASNQTIRVGLISGNSRALLPDRLTLRLVHPTRSGLDQIVDLRLAGGGRYSGTLAGLESGHWHLQLETASWRLVGRMPVPGTGLSDLSPGV